MEITFLISQLKVIWERDNILKIATGKEDDYTTGCLLDYNYIKKDKMIAIDLSKQEGLIQNQ